MEESGRKFWVAMAEDNSIPHPEPDEEKGFLPMYNNASPVVVPTDEGDDALCVFSTEGNVISYLRGLEQEGLIGGAKAFPPSLGVRTAESSLLAVQLLTSWWTRSRAR
jgi:hypothetical protein